MTSKRRGQIPLKDLWFRKVELAESLRILKDLEMLRNTPSVVLRSIEQRRWSPLPLHLISSYLNLILWYLILSYLVSSYIIISHFILPFHTFSEHFWIIHPRINLISKMIFCFLSPWFSNFPITFYSSLSTSTNQFKHKRYSLIHTRVLTHTYILTHVHTSLRYLSAVTSLDLSIRIGFNEDIVAVSGLSQVKII